MRKIIYILATLIVFTFVACDNYLDTVQDKRPTLETPAKIEKLLVSAYPRMNALMIREMMSDNAIDNGRMYQSDYTSLEQLYRWKDVADIAQDTPQGVWAACYGAISNANHALEALDKLDNPASTKWLRGEALIARAYAHFELVSTFCRAYSETTKDDLGLPYATAPETELIVMHERGDLETIYRKIHDDIQEGLPLIEDKYDIPKYHFNKKATNAFATRFYLHYGPEYYDKAIEYASEALGANPYAVLRDATEWETFSTSEEIFRKYIDEKVDANLLFIAHVSVWGRIYKYSAYDRFMHNIDVIRNETLFSKGPWTIVSGQEPMNFFEKGLYTYNQRTAWHIKNSEIFEILSGDIGYPHIVQTAFTTDRTLLDRAEAYALTEQYELAAKDLEMWYQMKTKKAGKPKGSYPKNLIVNFYKSNSAALPMHLDLNPSPEREVLDGDQKYLLYAIFHARRIETVHEGDRFLDIKRYGMRITHILDGEESLVLEPYDLRTAVQLPSQVLNAGMKPNPR